ALVKSYEASSISADDVQKYLDYSLNVEDIHLHREVFVSAYQVTNPDMSFEEAEDAVMELR
ncbi:TPA: hypothetical protein NGT30_004572, partial [Vibrio parahaemolyticus]|nr:hypothetical protein [Vibrio parahaemolyticus]HCE4679460.1 hypothetical protein [Vibrio parahaemolyticus]